MGVRVHMNGKNDGGGSVFGKKEQERGGVREQKKKTMNWGLTSTPTESGGALMFK